MDISFCIVNLNAKKYLSNCLKSIPCSTKLDLIEIVIVDNNSYDGSVDFLSDNYPEVKLIRNKRNEGYTKAMNQAMKLSTGDYRVILNPDTLLMYDSIDILIGQIKSDSNI